MDLLVELFRPLGLEFAALAHYLDRKLEHQMDLANFETLRRILTSPIYHDIAVNIQESMADVQEEAR